MTFETLGLSEELLRAVRATGYTTPRTRDAAAPPRSPPQTFSLSATA